ncbi:MAG TPA: 5-formyltetrahydrofolate cyclo-ligase [Tepidisphaeraceae bacterium]|nr:5-formyltetrahydrofolate cyclo-ligase [Tepidisphaeraceae bacterium]
MNKAALRKRLKATIAGLTPDERHAKSVAACTALSAAPEFAAARVVMLYLATPDEVDTANLALRCWQANKTVVVPKVSWDQRRMLPVEITSLTTGIAASAAAPSGVSIREPIAGKPVPVDFVDLVVVPGLGFSAAGFRIGRGMGFYDRFLAQSEFVGLSCGMGFEDQVIDDLPVLDHDMPLSMLVTDRGVRRFASNLLTHGS